MKNFRIKTVLLFLIFSQQVIAAPDYVTAWPKRVNVEKPDPVLGKRIYWEQWLYNKTFAKTFKGFSIDGANKNISKSVHAIALRIYKRNLWSGVNPDYPKQYTCELDIYFDNSIKIPLTARKREYKPRQYPDNVSESIQRLLLINGTKPVQNNLVNKLQITSVTPLVFPVPFDGRYASFGIAKYYKNITPSMSMVVLGQGIPSCQILAPLKNGGSHWVSLIDKFPFKAISPEGQLRGHASGYNPYYDGFEFNLKLIKSNKNYFRIPLKFYKLLLPKLTLVNVLNSCINVEYSLSRKNKTNRETSERCSDIRINGLISDPYLRYPREQGLTNYGY